MQTDDSDTPVTSENATEQQLSAGAPEATAAGPGDGQAFSQQATNIGRLEERLEKTRLELSEQEQRFAEELEREAQQTRELNDAWRGKLDKIKSAVAALREAHEKNEAELSQAHEQREEELRAASQAREDQLRNEHEQQAFVLRADKEQAEAELVSRDKDIAVLAAQLEGREQELERRAQENQEASQALERERVRSLEAILDTKMAAMESFARVAAERIARQIEVLAELEERSTKQEVLTDRLLTIVSPPVSPFKQFILWTRQSWLNLVAVLVTIAVAAGFFFVAGMVFDRVTGQPPATSAMAGLAVPAGSHEPLAAAPEKLLAPAAQTPVTARGEPTAEAAAPAAGESAEPSAVAVPPAPAAGTGTTAPGTGPKADEERRALQKKMWAAYTNKRWKETARLGTRLKEEYAIDWASQLKLADALRRLKYYERAVAAYQEFIDQYPTNANIDEALFKGANLLVKLKRKDEALPLYTRLLKMPKSKYKREAKKTLRALK